MGVNLMNMLKEVFPDRNGRPPDVAWKLQKFHGILHVVYFIILFGWSENTSGQWGEHAHIEMFKRLARLTNNKDVNPQFLSWHQRTGHLQDERLAHDESDLELESAEKGFAQCELALRFPMFYAATHFRKMEYRIATNGSNGRGIHSIDIFSLPASRIPQIWFVKEHPILMKLPTALAVFAYDFLKDKLRNLPVISAGVPSVTQANYVLTHHLQAGRDGKHLRTFSCLTLGLENLDGVQRIRSYPFGPEHQFHGKNNRPTVFVVPPRKYSGVSWTDFNFSSIKEATDKLWVGRIELLFSCSFRSDPGSLLTTEGGVECQLALISFFYPFNLPAAMGPMQKLAGAQMYYEPSESWACVVPVRHIVGRAPLMRSFVGGGVFGTIPVRFSSAAVRNAHFRHGKADSADGKRLGSKLFELNPYAWRFGRALFSSK
jgi:hypothetical protein